VHATVRSDGAETALKRAPDRATPPRSTDGGRTLPPTAFFPTSVYRYISTDLSRLFARWVPVIESRKVFSFDLGRAESLRLASFVPR